VGHRECDHSGRGPASRPLPGGPLSGPVGGRYGPTLITPDVMPVRQRRGIVDRFSLIGVVEKSLWVYGPVARRRGRGRTGRRKVAPVHEDQKPGTRELAGRPGRASRRQTRSYRTSRPGRSCRTGGICGRGSTAPGRGTRTPSPRVGPCRGGLVQAADGIWSRPPDPMRGRRPAAGDLSWLGIGPNGGGRERHPRPPQAARPGWLSAAAIPGIRLGDRCGAVIAAGQRGASRDGSGPDGRAVHGRPGRVLDGHPVGERDPRTEAVPRTPSDRPGVRVGDVSDPGRLPRSGLDRPRRRAARRLRRRGPGLAPRRSAPPGRAGSASRARTAQAMASASDGDVHGVPSPAFSARGSAEPPCCHVHRRRLR
jgi:hypothetical protein